MSDKRDIWPEFVYRYVEHYRWEPQHLGPTVGDFYAKIRRQEVPLNFLFNMLLYALPASYRRQLLRLAGVLSEAGPPLVVRNSRGRSFVQADMELDSELERVFVELKVTAKTGLHQVQKYLMLHALMAAEDGVSREPSLIFVTKNAFPQHWKENEPLKTPDALASLLQAEALPEKLRRKSELRDVLGRYREYATRTRIGFLTWQEIGTFLVDALEVDGSLSDSLLSGFVMDLERRGLWVGG